MFRRCLQQSHFTARAINAARFSTSSARQANRAIVYTEHGEPTQVLRAVTYAELPPPPEGFVTVKFRLSPINPADLNTIEGVYPTKPSPNDTLTGQAVFVAGNEGLAEVAEVGPGVSGLRKGDWVVPSKGQAGTWSSALNVAEKDVIKLPSGLSEVNAATMVVNPPTAYCMLHEFVPLKEGDWVVQNGANSAVGQAVIQIAAKKGFRTINFVRDRPEFESLKKQLIDLGATHVYTYDQLSNKESLKTIKEQTQGSAVKLMLNCVAGKPTTLMTRLLGSDAHLVSYGAMSRQPLALPTSAFIFKNLSAHGFWITRWYAQKSAEEREKLFRSLADFKLKEPDHEFITLDGTKSDEEATQAVKDAILSLGEGKLGKKLLLKIQEPDDESARRHGMDPLHIPGLAATTVYV